MNQEKLKELLGKKRYDEIQRLSKETAETVGKIVGQAPEGAMIENLVFGYDGDDFINNEITIRVIYKVQL